MRLLQVALILLLSACSLGPGPDAPCATTPGRYAISTWPRQPSLLCQPTLGTIDLTSPETLQAPCSVNGCTCTSDLTAPTNSCGPHQIVVNACGWPFLCSFSIVDARTQTGVCVQEWNSDFSCIFDAWLDKI